MKRRLLVSLMDSRLDGILDALGWLAGCCGVDGTCEGGTGMSDSFNIFFSLLLGRGFGVDRWWLGVHF